MGLKHRLRTAISADEEGVDDLANDLQRAVEKERNELSDLKTIYLKDFFPWSKKLGDGGQGRVEARCYRQPDGCIVDVAVKAHFNAGDMAKEARLLQQLQSAHIVKIFGIMTAIDPVMRSLRHDYLVMERMEHALNSNAGRREFCKRPLQGALHLAKGIAFLRDCQPPVLHRDIKPANVLISRGGVVKLGDFGFATILEGGQECTKGVGTAEFKAPEVRGGRYSTPADVYSFGQTLNWVRREAADRFDGNAAEVYDSLSKMSTQPKPEDRPTMRQTIDKHLSKEAANCTETLVNNPIVYVAANQNGQSKFQGLFQNTQRGNASIGGD